MRFKVGDRLVKVATSKAGEQVKTGDVVEVIFDPLESSKLTFTVLVLSTQKWWYSNPDKYELESIYNSPLYQALK